MKASVNTSYGSPDVLRIQEVPKPTPGDREVLIRVHATTVNRTDLATLRAKPFFMRLVTGLFKPIKTILGTEFAGKIEAVGKEVTAFAVGDRVFGFDDSGVCSHAEYMTSREDKALTTIPERMTYEQAAASTEGSHYAYNFINKVNFTPGQHVLVNGGSGAIGSALVQLAKYFGAHVTAVTNTKNVELVKSLGADRVIDYTKEDFTKENQTYPYIFDAVGKSTFGKCKKLLQPGSVYISSDLGPLSQNIFYSLITPLFGGRKVLFPIPLNIKKSVLLVKKLIEQGDFKAVIDRTYPLEQIVDAFHYVETGQKTGSVVINVAK